MTNSCLRAIIIGWCLTLTVPVTPITLLESVASAIIQRYTPLIYDVQIICEKMCVSDEFLRRIPVPMQFAKPRPRKNSVLFLLPQTSSFVSRVLDSVGNYAKSRYVIFVDCGCGECITVEWILEQCWQRKFLDVVVVKIQNVKALLYTYFPFREDACFDPTPVLIYSFTNTSAIDVELFPLRKAWNLQHCPVKVSTFDLYPGIYFDHMEMKGHYSPVFKAVAGAMNFSPEFVFTDGWFGSASAPNKTGIRGDVFIQRAHLGFSFFMPLDFSLLDYDSLAVTGCVTWCLPGTFKSKPLWWLVFGEFSPIVWLMLSLSAAGMVAIELIAQKLDPQKWSSRRDVMYIHVWAALLQVPGRIPRYSSLSLRAVWISWLLSSLVLSTAYLGTLKSFRTAPYIEHSVRNLEDLAEAGLQAWYHKGFADLVDEVSKSNQAVAKLKAESFVFPTAKFGTMVELLRHRNITGLMSDDLCRTYSEIYEEQFQLYPVPDACMQVTSYHFFVLAKNSVFTEPVRILMGKLNEAGIAQKSFEENRTFVRNADRKQRKITLKTVRPVLVLWACGLTVSSIVLALEWLFIIVTGSNG